ncbi:YdeI family protein [Chloroflexota bacterium]
MDLSQVLDFQDSHEWHQWLQLYHNLNNEAWLFIYKKRSNKTGISYEEALEEALCFGWIDGKMQSIDEEKFILRFSPRKDKSVWSKINKEKAGLLILQGRMTSAGLVKIEEAKKNGSWEAAYTNKIRDEIPFDLKEALLKNSKAWNNFERFANSYRNMYIGWVVGAKTSTTRKKRIMEVVKRSALNKKAGVE